MLHLQPATRWVGFTLGLMALSCSDAATLAKPDVTGAYSLMQISGDAQLAQAGRQLPGELVVRLVDRSGQGVAGIRTAFSVVSGGGLVVPATVATDRDGYARTSWTLGMAAGQQQAQASVAGIPALAFTATASLVAVEELARAVSVTPATYMFSAVGDTLRLAAIVSDSTGRPLPGATVHWTALDPKVASVDSTGTVVSRGSGNARVQASVGKVSGRASMQVQQVVAGVSMGATADTLELVGDTLRLSAIAVDRRGNPIPQVTQTWISLDPSVAAVDSAGLVLATGVGTTSVRAVAGAQYGSVTVAVRGRKSSPVARVVLAPSSTTLTGIGSTAQLTAFAYDASGAQLTGQQFKWSSGDASTASVNGNGVVTAKRAGATQVIAVAGGTSGSSAVTVVAPTGTAAKVVVTPSSPVIDGLGNAIQLTAVAYDQSNNALTGQTFTWMSGNAGVATVDASGVVKAIAIGTAQITAAVNGVQGSVSVSVIQTSVAVSRVAIMPASLQLTGVGATAQLTASAYDGAGNPVSGQAITWTSANGAVATVSTTGLVTAQGAGSTQISASEAGVQGSATVTVSVPASSVASVQVAPDSILETVGDSTQLTAQARDAAGNPLTGVTVTWSSLDSAVATVAPTGFVRGRGQGTARILATVGTHADTARAWVTSGAGTAPAIPTDLVLTTLWRDASTFQVMATWQTATGAASYAWTSGSNSGGWSTQGTTAQPTVTFVATRLTNANGYWFCVRSVAVGGATSSDQACKPYLPADSVPAASIAVTPTSANFTSLSSTMQFSASARDQNGNALSGAAILWTSSNSTVVTVDNNGRVIAKAVGTAFVIAAACCNIADTAAVQVTQVVASVQVAPSTATVTPGSTLQLSAHAYDAGSSEIPGQSFVWNSSDTTIAKVSATGLVNSITPGTATITATNAGVQGRAALIVGTSSSIPNAGAPNVVEDFSTYTSTNDMLSDPRGIYMLGEDFYDNTPIGGANPRGKGGMITLGTGDPTYGNFMRYTFASAPAPQEGGTISRYLRLPAGTQETWFETAIRFSTNFTISNGYTGGASLKDILIGISGVSGRYQTGWLNGDNGDIAISGPDDVYQPSYVQNDAHPMSWFADGKWHVVRVHVNNKVSMEWWLDGTRMLTTPPGSLAATVASELTGIALGKNINMQPVNKVQYRDWAAVKVWWGSNNPGW